MQVRISLKETRLIPCVNISAHERTLSILSKWPHMSRNVSFKMHVSRLCQVFRRSAEGTIFYDLDLEDTC